MNDVSTTLLTFGVLFSAGLLLAPPLARIGLPRVVGYLLAGVLLSPELPLGPALSLHVGEASGTLTQAALGVVAYLVGGSITVPQLRRIGRSIVSTTLGGALGPLLVVLAGVLIASPDLPGLAPIELALALGAIASATDAAATVAVLHEYHARGPLSTTLLGVVALDDALGLVLFALLVALATGGSLGAGLGSAGVEIAGSVAVGGVASLLLHLLPSRGDRNSDVLLCTVLAAVFLVVGVSLVLGLSPLLAGMTLGFGVRLGRGGGGSAFFEAVERLEEVVFLVFFGLAGLQFTPQVFAEQLPLIALYVACRGLGKVAGAGSFARLSGAPPAVSRWIGIGLLPQAGIALGLALTLAQHPVYGEASGVILNVVLGSTLVFELLGPPAVRLALVRAGECGSSKEEGS